MHDFQNSSIEQHPAFAKGRSGGLQAQFADLEYAENFCLLSHSFSDMAISAGSRR